MIRARIVSEPVQTSTRIILASVVLISVLLLWARVMDLSSLRKARLESLIGRLTQLGTLTGCQEVHPSEFLQIGSLYCQGSVLSPLPFLHPARLFAYRTLRSDGNWRSGDFKENSANGFVWFVASDFRKTRWLGLQINDDGQTKLLAIPEDKDLVLSDILWTSLIIALAGLATFWLVWQRPRLVQIFTVWHQNLGSAGQATAPLSQWQKGQKITLLSVALVGILGLIKCLSNPHLVGHLLPWVLAITILALLVIPHRMLVAHPLVTDLEQLHFLSTTHSESHGLSWHYPEMAALHFQQVAINASALKIEQNRLAYAQVLKTLSDEAFVLAFWQICNVEARWDYNRPGPEFSKLSQLQNPEVFDHLLELWVQSSNCTSRPTTAVGSST